MVKDKLKSVINNRVFYIIFSFIAACALWFYVAINENNDTTEHYTGINIEFSGEEVLADRHLVVTDIDTHSLTLELSGKRLVIAKLHKDDIVVSVDMSKITSAGTHSLEYDLDFETDANTTGVKVESASSNFVTVTVKELVTVPVGVRGIYDGEVEEGYIAGALNFAPATIEISGPEDEVSKVAYAWVVISRDRISKTVTEEVQFTLMDKDGVAVNSDNITATADFVTVTQEVSLVKTVPLNVNVIYGAGATEKNTVINIEPKEIMISGDAEVLEGINSITLGTIDLTSFKSSVSQELGIVIPNDVINRTGISTAVVDIGVIGLETTKISASNIQVTKTTEGYKAEIITQTLDITLRGPEADISKIDSDDIRIVASLEELGNAEGMYDVTAKVSIDGYPDVGAIGTYKVSVRITKN